MVGLLVNFFVFMFMDCFCDLVRWWGIWYGIFDVFYCLL